MYKTVIITSLIGVMIIGFFYSKKESSAVNDQVITPSNNNQPPSNNNQPPSTESGLTAYISPVTGELTTQPSSKLRTNQASAVKLLPNSQKDKESIPIKYTTYPNGMVRAQLNGHFMVPQSASLDCNGELRIEHAKPLEVAESCSHK